MLAGVAPVDQTTGKTRRQTEPLLDLAHHQHAAVRRQPAAVETGAQLLALDGWQADSEPPWDYRARRWQVAEQEAPEGCPIKGNISDNGRIYHAPWSPWYDRTKVSLDKGERWFCSEREALDAGWRAPRWR